MGNCQAATTMNELSLAGQCKRESLHFNGQDQKSSVTLMMEDTDPSTFVIQSTVSLVCKIPLAYDEVSLSETPSRQMIGTSPQGVESSYLLKMNPHDELGAIHYKYASIEDAKREAQRTGKPILSFNIEIPGNCETGLKVLSHPLIVEAAESLFITVLSSPQRANRALTPMQSTTIRVLDEYGVDLVEGVSRRGMSIAEVSSAMIRGLLTSKKAVPIYLSMLHEEESGSMRQRPDGSVQKLDRQAVFCVHDSEIGEVEFGGLDGVLATNRGYVGHQKVIQVTYASSRLSYCNLVRHALRQGIVSIIYYQSNDERIAARMELERVDAHDCKVESFANMTIQPDHDPKTALRQTILRHVPMTTLQATRVNRLVYNGVFNEAIHLLSPRQGMIMMKAMQKGAPGRMDCVDVPIARAWQSLD